MKNFLPLLLLLSILPQNQSRPEITYDGSPVTVVSGKWFRDRQAAPLVTPASGPAAAMIPQNKNFEKNRRANTSPGERDPNLDTIDGRSAAMDRAIQQSRSTGKPVDGYSYRAKIRNATSKLIEVIFWEFQSKESPTSTVSRRQFLCGVAIKPEKDKELQAFTLSGPADVVSVAALADKNKAAAEEKVVINRVEFADGSIWQRKDWNFGEVRLSYARAVATPWGGEMCRGL